METTTQTRASAIERSIRDSVRRLTGARGGGKTDAGMAWLLYEKDNPLYRALVIRKNVDDLKDWIDRAERMYSGTGAQFVGKPVEIRFPSGAKIVTGHLKDDQAFSKYQGHEYHRLLIEELTHIPSEESYLKLISSCRSTINIEPRIFATTNPGNSGHTWVKRRFIDPARPITEFKDEVSGRTRIFIPATVDDNVVLMEKDPAYVKFLESLPPDLKAQWRYGSWEDQKIKGAYYSDDMLQAQKEDRICILQPLPYEPVYVAWDLGINDIQVAWFYQVKGDQIRVIDLYADNNKPYEFYPQMLREKGYEYATMMLPHDGAKRAADSLRTFEQELKEAGYQVHVIKRTKDKNRDIQVSRTILPRCWFDSEKCLEGIEALTQYRKRWLEARQTFENKPYHDWTSNFADAFQALAVSLPVPLDNSDKEYNQAAKDFANDTQEDKFAHLTPKADNYEEAEDAMLEFMNL